jgi:hypothetical protein
MSFICPECGGKTLAIEGSLDLGADDRYDERALQVISCGSCGFTGAALYEESRRGSLGSESVDHAGYAVPEDVAAAVRDAVMKGTVPSGLLERIGEYGSFRIVCVPEKF